MPISSRQGQTFLSLVFLIGALIASVAITFVFLALSFASSGYAYQASNSAEAAATGGVEDAMIRLDRNSASSNTSTYALSIGGNPVNVSVTQNSPSAGYVTIVSQSTVSGNTRKISALISVNTTTGKTDLVSWQLIQ